jgi:hypothetical protein
MNVSDGVKAAQGSANHSDKGNRLSYRELVGGIVLIVAVVGAGAGYYAFNYITKDSERMKFWVGFMFSFAALAVIVVQSAIYVKQTEFMKQQIEATAIAERAYLAFTGMNIASPIANNTIVINAVLTNGGRTPAREIDRRVQTALVAPPPKPFDWDEKITIPSESGMTFLAGGADKRLSFYILNVTKELFTEFENGTRNIYVDGEIRFTDFAGARQVLVFGAVCAATDNRQFRERYQYQRDADPN